MACIGRRWGHRWVLALGLHHPSARGYGESIVGWYEVGLSHVLLAVAVNQLLQAAAAVAGSFVVADIDRQQVTAVRALPAGGNGLAWSTGFPVPPRPDAQ